VVSCGRVALSASVRCCLTERDVDELLSVEEKIPVLSLPIFLIIQAADPMCLFGRLVTCAARSIMTAHSS